MPEVIVIGGGPSGLTAAFKLRQKNIDALVLEEQPAAGGNIKTLEHQGYLLETGPHTFMGSNEFVYRLLGELKLENELLAASPLAENRYIFRDGKLHPLPNSFLHFLSTPLLSAKSKLRLMLEPLIPNGAKPLDTAWEFFTRRFGVEAATYIMGPFVSGIYAGDVKMLGARASFPKFYNFEAESGSMIIGAAKFMLAKKRRLKQEGITLPKGLLSFRRGLGALTGRLAEELADRLELSAPVESIVRDNTKFRVRAKGREWEAKALVLACPPPRASALFAGLLPEAKGPLDSIPMAPVALMHWSQKGTDFPAGFGFLMPRLYNLRVLGTLFPSQLFPNRAPADSTLFASFYGGMTDPAAATLPDDQLTALTLKEHQTILGRQLPKPEMVKILRYRGAIPQLLPDHPEKMAGLRESVNKVPGLFLAGNYLSGVGMEHAVMNGYQAAEDCAKFLS